VLAPRWTQTIRFRLSLFFALTSFALGSLLIGGVYQWQARRLEEPAMVEDQILRVADRRTGQWLEIRINRTTADRIYYTANLQAIDDLKRSSFGALAILFVASFGASWWVAGVALRPVHRMTRVARDITATDLSRRIALSGPDDELKGLADTFDNMLDRLETGFEDQRRFVQDASHELRNPLATARTNLDLALSDPDTTVEDFRHSAEVALRSTERMSSMVEGLLVQARSGVPELAMDDIDLAGAAADVVEEYRAGARQRRVTLELDVRDRPTVKGDGPALRRALGNLVSNAIKAAPPASAVTVTVSVDGHQAYVAVADAGPGLSDDEQERVFDRFWRGATSNGGSGLGLSIVRHVVERHGGRVGVASEPGLGSTFTVRLPTGSSGPAHPRGTAEP
jgi:signal transduction histidine kinase